MNENFVKIAQNTDISKDDWDSLISYLGDDVSLALATRMFFLLNPIVLSAAGNRISAFDYFLPEKRVQAKSNRLIREYIKRARRLVEILSQSSACEDVWYMAAQSVGTCNYRVEV